MFAFYCWKPITYTKANSKKCLATSKLFLDADLIRAWYKIFNLIAHMRQRVISISADAQGQDGGVWPEAEFLKSRSVNLTKKRGKREGKKHYLSYKKVNSWCLENLFMTIFQQKILIRTLLLKRFFQQLVQKMQF